MFETIDEDKFCVDKKFCGILLVSFYYEIYFLENMN